MTVRRIYLLNVHNTLCAIMTTVLWRTHLYMLLHYMFFCFLTAFPLPLRAVRKKWLKDQLFLINRYFPFVLSLIHTCIGSDYRHWDSKILNWLLVFFLIILNTSKIVLGELLKVYNHFSDIFLQCISFPLIGRVSKRLRHSDVGCCFLMSNHTDESVLF